MGLRKLKFHMCIHTHTHTMPNVETFASHSTLQNCEWDSLKQAWELVILLVFHRLWLRNFFLHGSAASTEEVKNVPTQNKL